ncbi:MAG: outer membrane beta-barrel protein [Hyphomicrobiales bacterium]|nr:outer membrane beta-barrel protein [Hyphomicrobiales bacterium]
MARNLSNSLFWIVGAVALLTIQYAAAQQSAFKSDVEANAVGNRSRPEYDPIGGRVGSFFIYPSLTESLLFDDNVYATNTGEVSDTILRSRARLAIRSDMPRHALNFDFAVDNFTYFDNSGENRTDVEAGSNGRIDIDHSLNLAGSARAGWLHEERGSADSPGAAAEPVSYSRFEGSISLNKQFSRLGLSVGGAVQSLDYSDVAAVGGGTIDQDFRDGEVFTALVKAAYEFSQGYRAFAQVEGNKRDFRNNKDSTGIELRGGIEFEISRLVLGEVSAGYLHQDYDTPGLADVDGAAFRGALLWNPTPLATVALSAERRVSETTVAGASGRLETVLDGKVDYEVLRNLILSSSIRHGIGEYGGTGRRDQTLTAGLALEYLINRYLAATAFVEHRRRDSNVAGLDYESNRIGGSLRLQMFGFE